jgi:hypothetical protein
MAIVWLGKIRTVWLWHT